MRLNNLLQKDDKIMIKNVAISSALHIILVVITALTFPLIYTVTSEYFVIPLTELLSNSLIISSAFIKPVEGWYSGTLEDVSVILQPENLGNSPYS